MTWVWFFLIMYVGNILPSAAQSRSVKKLEKVGPLSTLTHQTVTEHISQKTWKQVLSTHTHQTVAVPTVNPDSPDCHQTVEFFVERHAIRRYSANLEPRDSRDSRLDQPWVWGCWWGHKAACLRLGATALRAGTGRDGRRLRGGSATGICGTAVGRGGPPSRCTSPLCLLLTAPLLC